jgi:hypothetical protein
LSSSVVFDDLAISLNTDRRQLTVKERKALAADRKARVAEARSEGKSLRAIAEEEGVDVSQMRRDIESGVPFDTPDTEPPPTVTGRDGKKYAARKPQNFKSCSVNDLKLHRLFTSSKSLPAKGIRILEHLDKRWQKSLSHASRTV